VFRERGNYCILFQLIYCPRSRTGRPRLVIAANLHALRNAYNPPVSGSGVSEGETGQDEREREREREGAGGTIWPPAQTQVQLRAKGGRAGAHLLVCLFGGPNPNWHGASPSGHFGRIIPRRPTPKWANCAEPDGGAQPCLREQIGLSGRLYKLCSSSLYQAAKKAMVSKAATCCGPRTCCAASRGSVRELGTLPGQEGDPWVEVVPFLQAATVCT